MSGLQTVFQEALELVPHRGLRCVAWRGIRCEGEARQSCHQPSASASARKAVPPASLYIGVVERIQGIL